MDVFCNSSFPSSAILFSKAFCSSPNVCFHHVDEKASNEMIPSGVELPALRTSNGKFTSGIANIVDMIAPSLMGSSPSSKKEINEWIEDIMKIYTPVFQEQRQTSEVKGKLNKLDKELLTRVFFVDNLFSLVDLLFYTLIHPLLIKWTDEDFARLNNLARWFDFVQHLKDIEGRLPEFPEILINTSIRPTDKAKDALEKSKVQNGSSSNDKSILSEPNPEEKSLEEHLSTLNEEKKENRKQAVKTEKQAQVKAKATEKEKSAPKTNATSSLDVSRLDIRVGRILNVKKHEQADTLYIEQVDIGEAEPRQVVSGLAKFIPIEEMQNRLVLLVANLKATNFRGVKSQAMVLAASSADHTQVELLEPPNGSLIGERVGFDGFTGEPEKEINLAKSKTWESVSTDLHTNQDCIACYKSTPFKTSAGLVRTKSLRDAKIK